jgi:hypothetical protein
VRFKSFQPEPRRPIRLVQIHQHPLLQLRLPIIHGDAVIVPIQAVDERLDGGFVDVPDVGGGLARFLAEDDGVRVDEAEGVDDDFAFYGLDGVNDDGYCAGV